MATAIFVEAGFFLKRFPAVYPERNAGDPVLVARTLHEMALDHLKQRGDADRKELFRIFVYDCPPLLKKAQHPLSGRAIDFGKNPIAQFRLAFHQQLRCLRKVALRLGRLQDRKAWQMKPERLHALLRRQIQFSDLTDADFVYHLNQKGTDMRIGLDIASVSYKRQADQIILIAGGCDFVPAAKLARREGVDFVLDPMWSQIAADLHEHIDGLRSTCPRPMRRNPTSQVETARRSR